MKAISLFKRPFFLGALYGLCASSLPVNGETISYPALGNIELDRGTIEMWIIPLFDSEAISQRQKWWSTSFLELKASPENYLRMMWRCKSGNGNSGPYVTQSAAGAKFLPLWYITQEWQVGERQHLAFCWEPGRNWWIVNGIKVIERKQDLAHTFEVNENLQLVLGDSEKAGSFIVDDLRISSVPRAPEETGFHQPGKLEPDAFTLLLDTFDEVTTVDGTAQTTPKVMNKQPGRQGGALSSGARLVDGISGKGAQL